KFLATKLRTAEISNGCARRTTKSFDSSSAGNLIRFTSRSGIGLSLCPLCAFLWLQSPSLRRAFDQLFEPANPRFLFLRAHRPKDDEVFIVSRLLFKKLPRLFVLTKSLLERRRELFRSVFKRINPGSLRRAALICCESR